MATTTSRSKAKTTPKKRANAKAVSAAKNGKSSPKATRAKANPTTAVKGARGAISPADLSRFQRAFDAEPRNRQSMNAVTTTPVNKVALNRRQASQINSTFSLHLAENKATSQMSSGRCWLFAALNTFRVKSIATMKLGDDFELSQAYVCFWDKLEKANYFLENVLTTLDEPVGSRLLDFLLMSPIQDGGQWHMFLNLIQKYGVVPKSVMPETDSSSNTGHMNNQVTAKLREFAWRLRESGGRSEGRTNGRTNGKSNGHNGKASATASELRAMKNEMMAEIYRMLCIHLGEPPREFEWQWRDKDKKFHRAGTMTPQGFYKKYVGIELDDLVCLIHDPRPGHGFDQTFTVEFLGNVVGGTPVVYLNVDLDTMKRASVKQIDSGEPVWFGCDVGKFMDRDLGVMDTELFDYELLYGFERTEERKNGRKGTHGFGKAERLMYGHSAMNHAMVFTGVDLDEHRKPRKWRVENSWSDKPGDKGFFQMSDPWFDEYNYEVVVHKKYVPAKALKALEGEPIVLPPWDPMGSLAN